MLHENHLIVTLTLRTGNAYNLSQIYIDDANKIFFQGNAEYGADMVSISEFNSLSLDTENNTVYLFYYHLASIINVSGKTYTQLFS